MNRMRLAKARANAISWVTITMVMPSCTSWRMTSSTSADQLGIERRGHLVEQHGLGRHGERTRDRDTLLLAAGQPAGHDIDLVGETDARQQRGGQLLGFACAPCRSTRTGPSATFFSAVMCGKRLKLWKTMPTLARMRAMSRSERRRRRPVASVW